MHTHAHHHALADTQERYLKQISALLTHEGSFEVATARGRMLCCCWHAGNGKYYSTYIESHDLYFVGLSPLCERAPCAEHSRMLARARRMFNDPVGIFASPDGNLPCAPTVF
jgi:hypothetical protein